MPRKASVQMPDLRCFIAADDLTGSCDAAVHFARHGMAVQVAISADGRPHPHAQVFAVNTDSRCASEDVAVSRVKAAFQAMADQPCALFKKIDSSLRGHVSAEIAAAAKSADCDLIFIAPALPALGRTVTEGRVHLPSGGEIDIAAALAPLPFASIAISELAHPHNAFAAIRQAQVRGTKAFCFDASSDAHLDQIVDLGHTSRQRVLWAGSAGLAAALARAIAPLAAVETQDLAVEIEDLPAVEGALLFGIGSDHTATLAQVAKLRESSDILECSLDTVRVGEVREAVHWGRNVLLQLPPCGTSAAKARAFAEAVPLSTFGGMVLTGGDTASSFLKAIGAHTLDVRTEAMPGIPVSIIRGGIADSMCVITKSGAFGAADAFLRCIDFFRSSGKVMEESTRQ